MAETSVVTTSTADREIAATRPVNIEIVKPERLVYSHVSGPVFQATATLEAQRDKVASEFGAVEGLNQTLERPEDRLAKMARG